MVVFKLGGTATLPDAPPLAGPAHVPSETFSAEQIAEGGRLYSSTCGRCHGQGTRASNILPDLRRSPVNGSALAWKAVVMDGALENRGMIGFAHTMTEQQGEAIRAWVASEAAKLAANQREGRPER
jgi:mono/diheme cytochrome c family protein